MRPALKPALARLWRDESTLQLGVGHRHALVVSGLAKADRATLDALDGSWSRSSIVDAAPDPSAAAALLTQLERAGALEDAGGSRALPGDHQRLAPDLASLSLTHPTPGAAGDVLRRRGTSRVDVLGCGRVGGQVASLLAAAGVGVVRPSDSAPVSLADLSPGGLRRDDLGRSRSTAASAAVARAAASRPVPGRDQPRCPDLIVLAADRLGSLAPDAGDEAARQGIPLLVAGVSETTGVVGPLVLPGRSSCLRCQYLHRCDRDPGWQLLAAQLAGRSTPSTPCDIALATLVASLAVLQALSLLAVRDSRTGDQGQPSDDISCATHAFDRLPASVDGSLELSLPGWQLRRRSWPAHPHCACAAATFARGA